HRDVVNLFDRFAQLRRLTHRGQLLEPQPAEDQHAQRQNDRKSDPQHGFGPRRGKLRSHAAILTQKVRRPGRIQSAVAATRGALRKSETGIVLRHSSDTVKPSRVRPGSVIWVGRKAAVDAAKWRERSARPSGTACSW